MKVGAETLRALLEHNVVEIKFKRRRPVAGKPPTRRMLCTNSTIILKSEPGRRTLHYKSPGTPKYNAAAKNIVIAWDIFKQDYRAISMDNCELISQMPVSGDGSDFWQYFTESIHPMTPGEKESFFNV